MTDPVSELVEILGQRTAAVPARFTAFVSWLGITLTLGQRVAVLVAYDGLEPKDLRGDERDMARKLFGDVQTIPPAARRTIVAVCGRAGGKSYVLSALRMLHLALTVSLATLAPGEVAVALVVAPDKKTAGQVLRFALGAARQRPELKRRIVSTTAEGFELKRDDGQVSIQVLAATRGGSAVRGRSYVGAVLDECAFFRDADSGVVNDAEIYKAIIPRVMQGGQIVLASTPWAELGLLYDFHQRNHGHPVDAVSVHAPTLLLRGDQETRDLVATEYARDPMNAAREFGAEFMASAGEAFFDGEAIKQAIDETLILPAPRAHLIASVGADMGFRSDSAAQVVTLRDDVRITVASVQELRPEKGKPLKPSEVVRQFAIVARGFEAAYVVADGHYRESIQEHLSEHGLELTMAPEGAKGKSDTYTAVRIKLNEGRIRLPNHERLIRQLKEVRARPVSGGGISIVSPRWRTGGHGDIVSAFVLAAWDSARQMPVTAPVVYESARHAEAAAWEARIQATIARDANAERDQDGFSETW